MAATLFSTFLLAVYNNVRNLVPHAGSAYVAGNLAFAAALVVGARVAGLSWIDLGMHPSDLPAALVIGGVPAALVVIGLVGATRVRPARRLLRDRRAAGMTSRQAFYQAGVRIPFGTVVLEEIAFRGVLLAAWSAHVSVPVAVTISSAVFGLWHIGPGMVMLRENQVEGGVAGRGVLILGSVIGTAAAGVGFCLLRLWSGSVLAPTLMHVATNSAALLAAHHVHKRHPA